MYVGVILQYDRYRLGHLSVSSVSWLNVQSGYCKLHYTYVVSSTHVIRGNEKRTLGSMGRVTFSEPVKSYKLELELDLELD